MQEPLAGAVQSDQLIALTLGRLQELITRAVQEVTEPLDARIQFLEEARGIIEREKMGEASQDGQKGLD